MSPEKGRPTVQLLHELPDGTHHVDWMFAQDPRGTGPLTAFRIPERLEMLQRGHMQARRIPDHRPEYLTYEGEVSGARGTVRRVADGVIVGDTSHGDCWLVQIRWRAGPSQRLRVTQEDGETWRIELDGALGC